jgi:hypothetical protein
LGTVQLTNGSGPTSQTSVGVTPTAYFCQTGVGTSWRKCPERTRRPSKPAGAEARASDSAVHSAKPIQLRLRLDVQPFSTASGPPFHARSQYGYLRLHLGLLPPQPAKILSGRTSSPFLEAYDRLVFKFASTHAHSTVGLPT